MQEHGGSSFVVEKMELTRWFVPDGEASGVLHDIFLPRGCYSLVKIHV